MIYSPHSVLTDSLKRNGTPGWLRRWSVQLSVSAQVMIMVSWVGGPRRALHWQCGACLRFSLSLSLSAPSPLTLSLSLKINKILNIFLKGYIMTFLSLKLSSCFQDHWEFCFKKLDTHHGLWGPASSFPITLPMAHLAFLPASLLCIELAMYLVTANFSDWDVVFLNIYSAYSIQLLNYFCIRRIILDFPTKNKNHWCHYPAAIAVYPLVLLSPLHKLHHCMTLYYICTWIYVLSVPTSKMLSPGK